MAESDPPVPHRWIESDRFVPRLVVRPLQRFLDTSASSALLMLSAAVVALVWANSVVADSYFAFWGTPVRFAVGPWDALSGLTLGEWVTDGAMTLFFFVVALEIKRELVSGELNDPRTAALPVIAAAGGMIVPAGIYLAFNLGGAGQHGWGIPMATDIAFAVAVVAALGDRIPSGARLFLLSLAIVDDLGAILVIAAFYTADLSYAWLGAALLTIAVALFLQRARVRALTPYVCMGIACWYALHEAGVHPTLAGVAFGLVTPVWSLYDPRRFPRRLRRIADTVERSYDDQELSAAEYDALATSLRDARRLAIDTGSPLERLEHALAPWSAYVVVPLFAMANAGLVLPADALTAWTGDRVALGIVVGLLVGKTVGIFGATWLATRFSRAALPAQVTWRHLFGLAVCGGIGFTVALFITELAFTDPALKDTAKLGIFIASVLAAVAGYLVLRVATRPVQRAADAPPRRPGMAASS